MLCRLCKNHTIYWIVAVNLMYNTALYLHFPVLGCVSTSSSSSFWIVLSFFPVLILCLAVLILCLAVLILCLAVLILCLAVLILCLTMLILCFLLLRVLFTGYVWWSYSILSLVVVQPGRVIISLIFSSFGFLCLCLFLILSYLICCLLDSSDNQVSFRKLFWEIYTSKK